VSRNSRHDAQHDGNIESTKSDECLGHGVMSADSPEPRFLEMLVETLQALAVNATQQQSLLPSFVNVPYELISNYHFSGFGAGEAGIAVGLAEQIHQAGLITTEQFEDAQHLDQLLVELVEQEDLLTNAALQESPAWQQVRELATALLMSLGREVQLPRLSWITYVGDDGSDAVAQS
jgi:hypothetical protein